MHGWKNAHMKLFIWNRGQKSRSKVLKCVMALSLVKKNIYISFLIHHVDTNLSMVKEKKITVGQSNMHPNSNIRLWGQSSR